MQMSISNFEYFSPRSSEEACSFLLEHKGEARVLAGGQSLIPLMKLGLVDIKYVVDLKRIAALKEISIDGNQLRIGSLVTHSEIEQSLIIKNNVPLLSEAASKIGHPQVRNRGTIGGSLSHADPAADLIPTMLVLEANFVLASPTQRRRIRAMDFVKGPFLTDLRAGEILEKVEIQEQQGMIHSFEKLTLGHGDFPVVVVSVLARIENGSFEEVRIALGGVAEVPFRAKDAEISLVGKMMTEENFEMAAKIAASTTKPEGDQVLSKSYRKRMAEVYTMKALRNLSRQISGTR